MKRSYCLMVLLGLICSSVWGANTYSTARLQAMASLLFLPGIDTLSVGSHTHFSYRSHPVVVRVNPWSEVEHIGLKLSDDGVRSAQNSPVYDFLERHLLELNVAKGTEYAIRLGFDNVRFEIGDADDALRLDGTEEFSYAYQSFRTYQAKWSKNGKVILSLGFDLDCQLLYGCNSIELEKNFLKKIGRYRAVQPETSVFHADFPKDKSVYYIMKGSTFIIDAIRNDLYFEKFKKRTWQLVHSGSRPYQSIANTMLCLETEGNYDLSFTLDMYGYKEQKDTVKLRDWLGMCQEEGCTAYFGMKEKRDSVYLGTVFMVNESSGFVHMLSVQFPIKALFEKRGIIEGRMFVYVPLHNVNENFLNLNDYKRMDYGKK